MNLSLSKVEEEEEEDFLLDLVFLDMMLKSEKERQKRDKRQKQEKPMSDCKLAQKYRK